MFIPELKRKAIPLLNCGASWADTPAELTREVDYLFSMVGYPEDVESIYFDDHGVFSNLGGWQGSYRYDNL